MKKGNEIPVFRQRLKKLRKEHHYTQDYIAEKLDITTKTYRTWEKGVYIGTSNSVTYPEIDSDKLIKLSEIYSVSVDYLLGRSECVSVENSYINELTGLCDNAISTLKLLNMNNGSTIVGHNEIETLNILLSDFLTTLSFLGGLQDFLNTRYKIPVFHTGKYETVDNYTDDSHPEPIDNVAVPQCIVPNNGFDVQKGGCNCSDTYLLTLAKTKDKPYDNYQIPLTDDFFESIALKTIEKALHDLRKTFYERTDANETT